MRLDPERRRRAVAARVPAPAPRRLARPRRRCAGASRDGVAAGMPPAVAVRAAVAAVDARGAAPLRRGVERALAPAARPPPAPPPAARRRAAAARLSVRRFPHARDRVPRGRTVRGARPQPLRGRSRYSTGPDDGSPMRARLVRGVRPLRRRARAGSPAQLAAAIRADGIDILVDLKGHTEGARRPACWRCVRRRSRSTTWAIRARWAAPLVDYLIGDAVVTPAAACRRLRRGAGAAAGQLPDQRSRSGRVAVPAAARRARTCRRSRSCSAASTDATRSTRKCSTRGRGSSPQSRMRCCGCSRAATSDPAIANLRREAGGARRSIPRGWSSPRTRPNPEYLALYRARRPRSSTPGRTTRTPPAATRCGRAARC